MQRSDLLPRVLRGVALTLVLIFFLFPIVWIIQMSFHTNDSILSHTPQPFAPLTLQNYTTLISGKLVTPTGTQDVNFLGNLGNSCLLAAASVVISLILGVPAAYAFARFRFRLGEDIAFTLLSFRFAPPLLVLLPLSLYFQDLGLSNTYVGLIWVYQLITLPLILWIVRGYLRTPARTSSTPTGSTATRGGAASRASRSRSPSPASPRLHCSALSLRGTTSCSR